MALLEPIYNEYLQTAMIEKLVQNINILNNASNGAITFGIEDVIGDFDFSTEYAQIADLVERRDITSNSSATPKSLSLLENVAVTLDYKMRSTENWENFKRRGRSDEDLINVVGSQFAEQLIQRYLNLGIGALVNAVDNLGFKNEDLITTTASVNHLLAGEALYEEHYDSIAAFIMHSADFHALRKDEADNYKFDKVGGMMVVSGSTASLGRPLIVTNAPALTYDAGGSDFKGRILACRKGAVSMVERAGRKTLIEETAANENISKQYSADGAIQMRLGGYAYDNANGGRSPTDAAIQTGTNWDVLYENVMTGAAIVVTDR